MNGVLYNSRIEYGRKGVQSAGSAHTYNCTAYASRTNSLVNHSVSVGDSATDSASSWSLFALFYRVMNFASSASQRNRNDLQNNVTL